MKKLIFCALLCAFWTSSVLAQRVYGTYQNARFGYSIRYPTFLAPQRESQSGDGRRFVSRDGRIVLTVFGRNNTLNQTLCVERDSAAADWRKDGAKITFSRLGKNYFALSGYVGDNIFYEKTVKRGNNFHTYFYEYPRSQKKRMDAAVNRTFASFR